MNREELKDKAVTFLKEKHNEGRLPKYWYKDDKFWSLEEILADFTLSLPEDQWVSVEERLPNKELVGQEFLCYSKIPSGHEVEVCEWHYDGDELYFIKNNYGYTKTITHWKPISTPKLGENLNN